MGDTRRLIERELDGTGGVLRLRPTFVARQTYPGLGRLGLRKYYVGPKRGWICERWISSCVEADNKYKVPGEGLSFVALRGSRAAIPLRDALILCPDRMLGHDYAVDHGCRFGALTKILDIGVPIPWHIHAKEQDARRYWNTSGKEEAYYFLDAREKGPLPYSHIGVFPDVVENDLLPILRRWNDDSVLDLSPAYRLNAGQGFHLLPGIPHAPGTALTLEIQEESDVYNILQAFSNGRLLSKDLLLRGLEKEEAVLGLIDWEKSRDPMLYRKHHLVPTPVGQSEQNGKENWIFNPNRTRKFSGKEVRVQPGSGLEGAERGPYAVLVWRGEGEFCGTNVRAGAGGMDELFVAAETATMPHRIVNTGKKELVLYELFGPDVNKAQLIHDWEIRRGE